MENPQKRRIVRLSIALVSLILIATVGYYLLLNISLTDAFYMTVITISTVGYKEVVDMTSSAKIFSIFVIFGGIGIVGYTFTTLEFIILEGNFKSLWRHRTMKTKIEQLSDHIIIAGGSESSEIIIKQFIKAHQDFVIIEKNEEKYEHLIERDILALLGDATCEETLQEAGITRAAGFISTLHTDADNIVAVLTARYLNKKLYIVSRSIEKNAPDKLMKAGADKTVSSNEIGGNRMAALMLRPSIITFLDILTRAGDLELDLEDVIIGAKSEMIGQTLKDIQIPQKIGLTVLATKKVTDADIQFNPNPNIPFSLGDSLIVLGTMAQIAKLRELADDDGRRHPVESKLF